MFSAQKEIFAVILNAKGAWHNALFHERPVPFSPVTLHDATGNNLYSHVESVLSGQ